MKYKGTLHRNYHLLLSTAVLMLFSLCGAFCLSSAEAAPVGKFTSVEGKVDILKEGALPAVPAKVGDTVAVKDVVRTKSNARAEITFNDGNILRLAQRSRIDIGEYLTGDTSSKAVIKLPRGKVEAVVDKKTVQRISTAAEGNRFEIHTPVAVAGVRGTHYFVSHQRNITGIVVKSGAVYAYNPLVPKDVVTLPAGTMTSIVEKKAPQPPKKASEADVKKQESDTSSGKGSKEGETSEKTEGSAEAGTAGTSGGTSEGTAEGGTAGTSEGSSEAAPTGTSDNGPEMITMESAPLSEGSSLVGGDTVAVKPVTIDSVIKPITETPDVLTASDLFVKIDLVHHYGQTPPPDLEWQLINDGTATADISFAGSLWASSISSPAPIKINGVGSVQGGGVNVHAWAGEFSAGDGTSTTVDNGAVFGYVFGSEAYNAVEGRVYSLYLDPSGNGGIMLGKFSGTVESENNSFSWSGDMYKVQMQAGLGIPPEDLYDSPNQEYISTVGSGPFLFNTTNISPRTHDGDFTFINSSRDWGVWNASVGGNYSSVPAFSDSTWSWNLLYNDGVSIVGSHTQGVQWSNSEIYGKTYGYLADAINNATHIIVGETLGTFNSVDHLFQAAQGGIVIETGKFLDMVSTPGGRATLQQMSVPVVEVGSVTIKFSDGGNDLFLNNAKFFAPSDGASPTLWATGSVTGKVLSLGTDIANVGTVGGTNASFAASTMNLKLSASGNQWTGTISSTGTGTVSVYNYNVKIEGAVAGTCAGAAVPGTAIASGTAAGVVR